MFTITEKIIAVIGGVALLGNVFFDLKRKESIYGHGARTLKRNLEPIRYWLSVSLKIIISFVAIILAVYA